MTIPAADPLLDMSADYFGAPFIGGSNTVIDFDDMHADYMGEPFVTNEKAAVAQLFFLLFFP